ncbi:MAG: PAS domain S-box protein [Calditrichaceae bacterium]|nr:PAS domain S-box protein [Calditrichaceae bacterium]
MENENAVWIKSVLSEVFHNDVIYYQINYDLYSENIHAKIDLLLMDFEFCKNSIYKRDCFNNPIPLIICTSSNNSEELIAAIDYHPYDIWIKNSSSKKRIINSVKKIIDKTTADEQFNQFKEIIKHLPISIVITDTAGKIQYANPQFEKVCGYSLDELIDQNPSVLKSGVHDEEYYRHMWQIISAGGIWEGEICNKNKKGSLYLERLMIFPYKNKEDQITHFIGLRVDDTDRRRAEALKNIKELAGGIAHEFSQPLQVISISLSMLETKMRNNDLFARIKRMVDKIIELVSNLKNITEIRQQDYLDTQILDLKASSQKKEDAI